MTEALKSIFSEKLIVPGKLEKNINDQLRNHLKAEVARSDSIIEVDFQFDKMSIFTYKEKGDKFAVKVNKKNLEHFIEEVVSEGKLRS